MVQVWDTTGQDRFRATIRPYYRGVSGALVTFNTAQIKTFENLTWWLEELKEHCEPDLVMLLVAHRIDMKREPEVKPEVVREFAEKNDMIYVETSLTDNVEFESAFSAMVRKIHKTSLRQSSPENVTCIKCLRNARKVSSDEDDDDDSDEDDVTDVRRMTGESNNSSFYV